MSEVKFEPFQKVLVRFNKQDTWKCNLYSHYEAHSKCHFCCGAYWNMCIPYEGNEHLLGTTDSPTPPKPEFKWGDHVEVRNEESEQWRKAVFCSISQHNQHNFFYCLIEPSACCLWTFCRHADW